MDDAKYKVWWQIHLRAARGESLDAIERVMYEAGRAQLHQAEVLANNSEKLRESRAVIQGLEAEQARLHNRRHQLDEEIAALEAVLDDGTRAELIQ